MIWQGCGSLLTKIDKFHNPVRLRNSKGNAHPGICNKLSWVVINSNQRRFQVYYDTSFNVLALLLFHHKLMKP
jgi:hypothetical protein